MRTSIVRGISGESDDVFLDREMLDDMMNPDEEARDLEKIKCLELCGAIASISILIVLFAAAFFHFEMQPHGSGASRDELAAQATLSSAAMGGSVPFRVEVVSPGDVKSQAAGSELPIKVAGIDQAHHTGLLHKGALVFVFDKQGQLLMSHRKSNASTCAGALSVIPVHQSPLERSSTAAARTLHADVGWLTDHRDFDTFMDPVHIKAHFPNGHVENQITNMLLYHREITDNILPSFSADVSPVQQGLDAKGRAKIHRNGAPRGLDSDIASLRWMTLGRVLSMLEHKPEAFCGSEFAQILRQALMTLCTRPRVRDFKSCKRLRTQQQEGARVVTTPASHSLRDVHRLPQLHAEMPAAQLSRNATEIHISAATSHHQQADSVANATAVKQTPKDVAARPSHGRAGAAATSAKSTAAAHHEAAVPVKARGKPARPAKPAAPSPPVVIAGTAPPAPVAPQRPDIAKG